MPQCDIIAYDNAFDMDTPIVSIKMFAKVDMQSGQSEQNKLITFNICMQQPDTKCALYIDNKIIGNCKLNGFDSDMKVLHLLVTKTDGISDLPTTLFCNHDSNQHTKDTLQHIQDVLMKFAPREAGFSFSPRGDDTVSHFATRMRLLIQ
tara:strand:- start:1117 stop:1563 length:447 start_codon:yes stop_codon:yes gene_type:complete